MSDMLARLMALAAMQSRADLSDYYTKAETDRRISDEVARIVSDAPEDFDTLRELSDWIATHEESAAAMNSAIQANTAGVAALYAEVAAKLNTSDVDSTLSSTSTNPVQNKSVQAPIARLVDAGAKNLFKNTAPSQVVGGVTFTMNLDGTITANGTKTNNDWLYLSTGNSLPSGIYVLSSGLAPRERADVRTLIATDDSLSASIMSAEGQKQVVTRSFSQSYSGLIYAIRISSGTTVDNLVFKPMLCTAEDYAISPEFVPYAPSNRELFEAKADKSIVGLKLVASNTMASSSTYTYAMNKNDFIDSSPDLGRSIGTYIISIMPWSTTPNYSLYAVSYTGGTFQYTLIVKIAGVDRQITVENGVISVSGLPSTGGKISIHALQ